MNEKHVGATVAPRGQPAKKVSMMDAVRAALAKLGKAANRGDIAKFAKDNFGLTMTGDQVSNCKTELAKQAKRKAAARKQAAKPPAAKPRPSPAVKATAAPGNGKGRVALDDVLAVKGLVDRLGAEALRTLVAAFSK